MYLDVFDVLDVFGCIWMYLDVFGCMWMYLDASEPVPHHSCLCISSTRCLFNQFKFCLAVGISPRNGVMLLREVPVCCTYVAQHIRRGVGTMDGLVDIKNSRSSFAISIEEDGVSIMLLFVKPCLQFCAG